MVEMCQVCPRKASDPGNLASRWEECLKTRSKSTAGTSEHLQKPSRKHAVPEEGEMGKKSQETWRRMMGRWGGQTTSDQTSLGLTGYRWVLSFNQHGDAEN